MEMQIKTTVDTTSYPKRQIIKQTALYVSVGEIVEKLESSYIISGNVKWYNSCIYYLTVSMDQEFGGALAGWFYLRFYLVNMLVGAAIVCKLLWQEDPFLDSLLT